jgi:hypothetical protein
MRMPRNRLLAQIDEELVHARDSLKFWRDQMLLLTDTEFEATAKSQVEQREREIQRLLDAQERLLDASSPSHS